MKELFQVLPPLSSVRATPPTFADGGRNSLTHGQGGDHTIFEDETSVGVLSRTHGTRCCHKVKDEISIVALELPADGDSRGAPMTLRGQELYISVLSISGLLHMSSCIICAISSRLAAVVTV